MAVKATKAISKLRTQQVYGYLSQGYSRNQILQATSDWGLTDRQVDTYIKYARDLLEQDCQMSRQQLLAEMLQRLRQYEQAAAKRGQYQVAVNSAQTQARLIGLDS